MSNPITTLLPRLENPADLNLDQLLEALREAGRSYDELRVRTVFCEHELQRELKALIELIGPIPSCTDADAAYSLHGEPLVQARREARKQYNEVFRNAPIRRS